MNRVFLFLLIIFPLLFSGCLRTYYPLHNGISSTPMIFEPNSNTNEYSSFLGPEVTVARGFHEDETISIARGIFSTAYTTDHSNTNFEAFSFVGNYKVTGTTPKYNGNKFAIGLGGGFKFALNFKVKDVKFGAGFNIGLQTEFGTYTNFLKNASEDGFIKSEGKTLSPIFTLFPFIAFPISNSKVLSLQMNVGFPEGVTPSILLSGEKLSGWISFVYIHDDNNISITRKFVFGMKFRL